MSDTAIGKYLTAQDVSYMGPPANTRKTKTWRIINNTSKLYMGGVGWYSPWRCYVFTPVYGIFNAECLEGIAKFLNDVRDERRT